MPRSTPHKLRCRGSLYIFQRIVRQISFCPVILVKVVTHETMACSRASLSVLKIKPLSTGPQPVDQQTTIAVGSTLPSVPITLEDGTSTTLYDYFSVHPGVIFTVPGAFTPTCSERHFPGFLENASRFKSLGLQIFCLAVNDAFVLNAWRTSLGGASETIGIIADPDATAVKSLGIAQDLSHRGLGVRAQRCAIVAARGVVHLAQWDEESFADVVLERLHAFSATSLRVKECIEEAQRVVCHARAPYSKRSACGVAIQTNKGILKGCTVENCAYPHGVCGIKAALAGAISEGITRIDGLVFVGDNATTEKPKICGHCREFAAQFGAFPVIAATDVNQYAVYNTTNLLPQQSVALNPLLKRSYEIEREALALYRLDPSVAAPEPQLKALYEAAVLACSMAYTPVSHFPVGAAVLTDVGIFSGCNVEHPVIAQGICAERNTLCKAVAAGATQIKCLALVCFKMEAYGSPCGGCRQSLVEFENFPVHLLRMNHTTKTYEVSITSTFQLLPDAFTPAALK